jgi:uncharacterized membrane protein
MGRGRGLAEVASAPPGGHDRGHNIRASDRKLRAQHGNRSAAGGDLVRTSPETPEGGLTLSEPFVTSDVEEAGTEAVSQPPRDRFVPAPANETAPPSPPQAANSDLAAEPEPSPQAQAEPAVLSAAAVASPPAPAQEWPLAWLRLVEPEPPAPAPEDEAVAAVIAAEPAGKDEVAHAFGLAMAAALDHEPEGPESETSRPAAAETLAFFAAPAAEPALLRAAPDEGPIDIDEALASALEQDAFETPEAVEQEPETRFETDSFTDASALVTPSYASRASARRRPQPQRSARAPVTVEKLDGTAGEGGLALSVYLFYLAGFLAIPAVVGVIIAHNARRTAPEWLQSHYLFQIRTFWIGLAGAAIGAVLLFSGQLTLVGLLLWLALVVWMELRSALGFIDIVKLKSYPRPRAWLI